MRDDTGSGAGSAVTGSGAIERVHSTVTGELFPAGFSYEHAVQ